MGSSSARHVANAAAGRSKHAARENQYHKQAPAMPVRSFTRKQTPRIDRCLAFSDTYSRSIKLVGQASSVIKYKKFVSLSDPLTGGKEGEISKSGFNLLGVKWLHCRGRLVTEADALI